jgi:predicted metal-dependent HD superfamily phosphohydrolase
VIAAADKAELARRWEMIAARAKWSGDSAAVSSELAAAYDGAGRHYHDLRHVLHCLRLLDEVRGEYDDADAIEAAIWFHDAVYDATRPDNEARSADLAERQLRAMGAGETFVITVHDLILDTRHTAPPTSADGRWLVDIDLSILAAPAELYDAYDQAIRLEYAHVPEKAYRAGRTSVLRSFLARPAIYLTEYFRVRYEAAARDNLARSIRSLANPGGGNGRTDVE